MKVGLGHFRNFLNVGLKARRAIGGITTSFDGFISYSMIGAIDKIISSIDSSLYSTCRD
jgi:hypothetical protein